jgi:phage terminase small subunit
MPRGYKQDRGSLEKRYELFVQKYIEHGFNATKAYKDVYESTDDDNARSSGSRLLLNVHVWEILHRELAKIDFDKLIDERFILQEMLNLMRSTRNDQVKARMLEVLSKIKGLGEINTQNLGILSPIIELEKRASNRLSMTNHQEVLTPN